MRNLLIPAVTLLGLFSLSPAAAQCSPLPGTGCPGAAGLQCGGSSRIGQALKLSILSTGRAAAQFLIGGRQATSPLPLTPPITCVPGPCTVAVDLAAAAVVQITSGSIALPIPANPALINVQVCFQGLELIATSGQCVSLTEAATVVIAP